MLNISFLIKPSEADTKGRCIVYCRFQVTGSVKKELSTGIKVLTENWNNEAEEKIKPPKNSSKTDKESIRNQNETLRVLANKIRSIYNRLFDKGKTVTASLIKQEYLGRDKQKTLTDAFEYLLKQYPSTSTTTEKFKLVIRVTNYFLKDTYKLEKMYFSELGEYPDFFQNWEYYVKGNNEQGINWKNTYAQKMFAYLKRAIEFAENLKWVERGLVNHTIKVKNSDVEKKEFLTLVEIQKIKEYKFENESLQRVADVFLFQCCTGLAYADVKILTFEHIKKNNDDILYLHHPRKKSKTNFTIPLIPLAIELIEKYRNNEHRRIHHQGFVLPVKSTGKMNEYLKHIATVCDLGKNITTHCARYTCNQLLYEAGVSDELRKQILGHSAVKMTAEYTTRSTALMNEAMSKLKI
jgi:integrase